MSLETAPVREYHQRLAEAQLAYERAKQKAWNYHH
jgi:hypothetical protein